MNTTQSEILKELGMNIRYYRRKKGWSQEQLAFECNLHRIYIGAIERGERNITILNLVVIIDALNVKIDQIYTR